MGHAGGLVRRAPPPVTAVAALLGVDDEPVLGQLAQVIARGAGVEALAGAASALAVEGPSMRSRPKHPEPDRVGESAQRLGTGSDRGESSTCVQN